MAEDRVVKFCVIVGCLKC